MKLLDHREKTGDVNPANTEAVQDISGFDIKCFRYGYENSFHWVYRKLSSPLLYYGRNLIKSDGESEDVVAAAFLKLYQFRERFISFEHIKRWMYIVVRNACIDHIRDRSKGRQLISALADFQDADEIDHFADIELLKTHILQSLNEAIEDLPRQRKVVLRLYFFEGKTTDEIAKFLKLDPQTILNHKTRALQALRNTVLKPEWLPMGFLLLQSALVWRLESKLLLFADFLTGG